MEIETLLGQSVFTIYYTDFTCRSNPLFFMHTFCKSKTLKSFAKYQSIIYKIHVMSLFIQILLRLLNLKISFTKILKKNPLA